MRYRALGTAVSPCVLLFYRQMKLEKMLKAFGFSDGDALPEIMQLLFNKMGNGKFCDSKCIFEA